MAEAEVIPYFRHLLGDFFASFADDPKNRFDIGLPLLLLPDIREKMEDDMEIALKEICDSHDFDLGTLSWDSVEMHSAAGDIIGIGYLPALLLERNYAGDAPVPEYDLVVHT